MIFASLLIAFFSLDETMVVEILSFPMTPATVLEFKEFLFVYSVFAAVAVSMAYLVRFLLSFNQHAHSGGSECTEQTVQHPKQSKSELGSTKPLGD